MRRGGADNPLVALLIERGPLFSDEIPPNLRVRAGELCRDARTSGWAVYRTRLEGVGDSFYIFYLDRDSALAYKRVKRHRAVRPTDRRPLRDFTPAILDGRPVPKSSPGHVPNTELVLDFVRRHPHCTANEIRRGMFEMYGRVVAVGTTLICLRERSHGPRVVERGPPRHRTYVVDDSAPPARRRRFTD